MTLGRNMFCKKSPHNCPTPEFAPGFQCRGNTAPWGRLSASGAASLCANGECRDRKSTRLNSSHLVISYAVFCLKKKKKQNKLRHARLHQHPEHTTVHRPGRDHMTLCFRCA